MMLSALLPNSGVQLGRSLMDASSHSHCKRGENSQQLAELREVRVSSLKPGRGLHLLGAHILSSERGVTRAAQLSRSAQVGWCWCVPELCWQPLKLVEHLPLRGT